MALVATEQTVKQIVFGYPSGAAALAALDPLLADVAIAGHDWQWLIERLQNFAAGRKVDFSDVSIEQGHLTPFQRRVIKHCRAIPYARTRGYGEVAALAGSPRAARAVGNTMATNRHSIVVPCHRVVNADGSTGRYGGPGGSQLKRRLLAMEQNLPSPLGTQPRTASSRPAKRRPQALARR